MRKAAGFEISDRIVITYSDSPRLHDILGAHGHYIREETLANELIEGPAPANAYAEDQNLDGDTITLAVRRVP
jgi:isoleucyl-tRNA synthetase